MFQCILKMLNTYKYLTKSFKVFKYAEVVILNFSVKKRFS